MQIAFDEVRPGGQYSRRELASLWQCKSYDAIRRGVVTPRNSNTIVLFTTQYQKRSLVQYRNEFDGELLWMDGEQRHSNDDRLASSLNRDEVHLFFREYAGTRFKYEGRVFLIEAFISTGSEPSRFLFSARKDLVTAINYLSDEAQTSGDPEGRKKYRLHLAYERSRRNRERAIALHGTRCFACEFSFDEVYGEDLARSYIEVHHIKSITTIDGAVVDPTTDLIPLCANCHRMAHRRGAEILPLEELRRRVGHHAQGSRPVQTVNR
jgi:5-methylcytosine-specific restriction enzyme A